MNNLLSISLKPKISYNINLFLIALGFGYLVCVNSMFFSIFTVSIISAIAISALIELCFQIKIDFKYSLIFALGVTMCLSYQDPAHSKELFQALEEAAKKIIDSSGNDGIDDKAITNFFIFVRVIIILGLACLVVAAAWVGNQQQDPSTLIRVFAIALFSVLAVQFLTETIL